MTNWLIRPRKFELFLALLLIALSGIISRPQAQVWLVFAYSLLLLETLGAAFFRRHWWNGVGECRFMSPWERHLLMLSACAGLIFLGFALSVYLQHLPFWPLPLSGAVFWMSLAAGEFWAAIHLLSRTLLLLLPRDSQSNDARIMVHSEQDIIDAVLRAGLENRRVRAVGSRCSSILYRTPGEDNPQLRLEMSPYNNVISFEPDVPRIHVQAGMLQSKLCELLSEHKLALPALNGSGKLTVGGTISTGSICGSVFLLSDCILAITVIEADGKAVRVSRDEDPEIFGAYLCSLGLLGVISSIEFAPVPEFVVKGEFKNVSFQQMLQLAEDKPFDYSIHDWYPLTGQVISRQFNRLPVGETLMERRVPPAMTPSESVIGQLLTALVNHVPPLKPLIMKLFVALFKTGPVEGMWFELISVDPEFDLAFHPVEYLEVVIERAQYKSYMEDLHNFYLANPDKIPFVPIITDWIAPDKSAWLSKNSSSRAGDSSFAAITVAFQLIEKNAGYDLFQPAIQLAEKYDVRMHWGKHPWMQEPAKISNSLPPGNFDKFSALRNTKDPDGRFLNPFFQSIFK